MKLLPHPLYLAGEFCKTSLSTQIKNPYSGKPVAETFLGTWKEVNISVQKALEVRKALQETPSYKKSGILHQIASEIEKNRQHLAGIITSECAKPLKLSLAEVDRAVFTFQTAAEEAKRLPKEYIDLDWMPAGENKEGLVKYFPLGIIAGFTPFNFPLNLVAHKVAPAIAAGCPIIIKPSPKTPLSALELAKIIDKTPLSIGAFSVIPLRNEDAHLFTDDDRIQMLSFTGSPSVGWMLKEKAGKKKVVLELGGNAGVIVSDDCDLNLAVKKCVGGGFSYSGQTCIHTQRIYVHKNIFSNFTGMFLKGVKNLKAGDPTDPATDISVMIDEPAARRTETWVKEAVKAGAKILCGGKRKGNFFEPTVLTNTDNAMNVCSEEVFAPVVVLEPYDTFEKAVAMVNDSEFGLQAGVFTDNQKRINHAFSNLDVGGVIINNVPNFRMDHMPYGGIKNSGLGREGVKYAIVEMMEPRLLVMDK